MYVRTQETEVQRHEYAADFDNFGSFFEHVLGTHEDASILTQMFAKDGIHGHSLPVWTMTDLKRFEVGEFWADEHSSDFKAAVVALRNQLLSVGAEDEDSMHG